MREGFARSKGVSRARALAWQMEAPCSAPGRACTFAWQSGALYSPMTLQADLDLPAKSFLRLFALEEHVL